MLLYKNTTRFNAIVTLRIVAIQDPKKDLQVGHSTAMKNVEANPGVYDILAGPGEQIDIADGASIEFVASRGLP